MRTILRVSQSAMILPVQLVWPLLLAHLVLGLLQQQLLLITKRHLQNLSQFKHHSLEASVL